MNSEIWFVSVLVPIMVALFGSTWVGELLAKKRQGKTTTDEIMGKLEDVDERVTNVESSVLENNAITARVRIIRFNDELLQNILHSKDSFDQCLADIDIYENYCMNHPEFNNNKTSLSVENIKNMYKELLNTNGFLKAYNRKE